MIKTINFLFLAILITSCIHAQSTPPENALLHYRMVGFSVSEIPNTQKYTLEIARGNFKAQDDFEKNILITKDSKANEILAEVPDFGTHYTWRISTDRKETKNGRLHHFTTDTLTSAHKEFNITIEHLAETYKDGYFFLDCSRALYDMTGKPVWFIPERICGPMAHAPVEDIKTTSNGTITFLHATRLYEIDYNGNILFMAPRPDGQEDTHQRGEFHHEFNKLSNNNYMALGKRAVKMKAPDRNNIPQRPEGTGRPAMPEGQERPPLNGSPQPDSISMQFATLEEIDGKGKVIWKWDSYDYLLKSDLAERRNRQGRMHADLHINAFYFDEKKGNIYIGGRDMSRIVKIKYPEGNVISEYGVPYTKSDPASKIDEGPFCMQHSCVLSATGQLMVYNNNACKTPPNPKLMIFEETGDGSGLKGLRKIWEYEYVPKEEEVKRLSTLAVGKAGPAARNRGGNMYELPDGSIFAALNSPYNRVFIINRNKKILWQAAVERLNSENQKWEPHATYRASMVPGRQALEDLIKAAK